MSTSAHVCNEWTEDRAGKAGEIGTTSHDQRRISFTDAVLGKPRFRVSLTTRPKAVDAPLSKHKDIADGLHLRYRRSFAAIARRRPKVFLPQHHIVCPAITNRTVFANLGSDWGTDAVLGKPRFRVSLTTRQNAVDAPLSKHKDIAMVSICHTVKVLLPSPGGGPKYSFPNITLFAPQSQTAPYLQTGGAPAS